jgi:uncharacterized protein with GYD domain
MPKFLWHGSYTPEGVKSLITDGGTQRRADVEKLIQNAGGTVEHVYWGFGEDDIYVIADLPDNVSAGAISLAVARVGLLRVKTTVLLTAEEIDEATKRAEGFRPPGS